MSMKDPLDDIMKQINQLSETGRKKIFNILLYQRFTTSTKDKETIDFLNSSTERLDKWISESDKLIKETNEFIDDIKKSA